MAGYRTFEITRPSLSCRPPEMPVVDVTLVRGPFIAPRKKRPTQVRFQARRQAKPDAKLLIPAQPATLKDVVNASVHPMRRLTALVSYTTGIPVADIQGISRRGPVSKARQILFWIAKTYTSYSFPEIGRRSGGRDHSTVIHGVRRVQAVLDSLNIETTHNTAGMAATLWSLEWPRTR
jgi:hypothetical protein